MAAITKRLFLRHLQSTPTSHVRRLKNGEVANEGAGTAFWFRPLGSTVSELPIDELERSVLFRSRTSDFQEVSVQATITYRIVEPKLAASRLDFSIDTDQGHWNATPLEQLGGILTEMAQQHAVGVLAEMTLAEVMATGIPRLRETVSDGLTSDPWLNDAGVGVVSVRVIAVRPEADIEKALQNPIREHLQQEADRATFARRALAVQQERAISENELENRIELAKREEELVAQEGANERSRASAEAEANHVRVESEAEAVERNGLAVAERIRATGMAKVDTERAQLEAYAAIGEATLMALAVKELAGNLPAVDTLVLSPDLITPLLAKLLPRAAESVGAAGE